MNLPKYMRRWLSTVSRPLAEQGYYVFPVAVVDAMMKENGLPTPHEMHQVSLKKIDEIIGADAVLYVTLEDWGQKYQVINSVTKVKFRARLVDVKSGDTLWEGDQRVIQSSGVSVNPVVMLVSAAVTQIINSVSDSTYPLSKVANSRMIMQDKNGFLRGHYHPEEKLDVRGR